MDDHTSRKQIDELADLYLTGVVDEAEGGGPETPASPIEGPEPIRLSPKPAGGLEAGPVDPIHSFEQAGGEPDDRHPVLRLTETDNDPPADDADENVTTATDPISLGADPSADREPAPRAVLEAALLGNLPGMSGPWLTQYAQLIAQTEGPVALLHVGENAIDLELVEPRTEAEPAPLQPVSSVRIPPMRGNKTGLVGLVDALTRSETSPTRTILVRIDASTQPQTLSRLAAIDDWTLLCGSDDASVAGAARQIHTLVQADPRLADRNIGLMVMGSDEPTARAAADRVAQNAAADLVNRVEFIGHLKRMQPVQVREIGSFADPVGVWPQLVAWFDTLEAPEPTPVPEPVASQPTPTPQPPREPEPSTDTEPKPQRLSPAAARIGMPGSRPEPRPTFRPTPPPKPRPAPAAARQQPAEQTAARPTPTPRNPQPEPTAAAPTSQPQPTPQPALTPPPKPAASAPNPTAAEPTRPAPRPRVLAPQPELDLIALIAQGPAALDDPAALDARIPDQPDTQLAVDARGVVHVLMKKGSDPVFGEMDSFEPRQAVMQLIEAGRWVREHLELLALTQRDRTFIDHDPTLHLLTDRADLTTQLVGKLSGQVKLHLLQRVQVGRESGWFCTPLG